MGGPFDIHGQEEDRWGLQGSLGSFVYPAAIGVAGWATRRGAVAMAQGGSFMSGVWGGGLPLVGGANPYEAANTAAEKFYAASASRHGMFGQKPNRVFNRMTGGTRPPSPYGNYVSPKETGTYAVRSPLTEAQVSKVARAERSAGLYRTGMMAKSIMRGMNAYIMANLAVTIGEAVVGAALDYRPRSYKSPASEFGTANPLDSGMGYTMRQRTIGAIHSSYLSTRAALGNEASFMMNG